MRILLVDDHILFRKGLGGLLAVQPDFQIVGEAGDGLEALALARELMPDLILMDINMPNCDGKRATARIKQEMPYVQIIMLTVSDDDQDLFEAIKAGAQGYLLKNTKPEDLYEMLRGVARGEAPLSRLMASKILREFARGISRLSPQEERPESQLTVREKEVLQLVTDGLSNHEIAERLVITENTVKNHLRNILAKLHLDNRVQAAAYAVREGLARPPVKEE